jgi:transcriptional regulator with XRE-family HTH domain
LALCRGQQLNHATKPQFCQVRKLLQSIFFYGTICAGGIDKMNIVERYMLQEQERNNSRKDAPEPTTLGSRLALARKISGTSQLEAATALGLETAGLISKYETDRRRPAFESIKVLAELYACPLQELIPIGDPYERFLTASQPESGNESSLAFRPGIVTAKVKDDTMAPVFLKGDLVLADSQAAPIDAWGYALIKSGNGRSVCLLIKRDDLFYAQSLHPCHSNVSFTVEPKNILGRVIELRRSFSIDQTGEL